MGFRSESCFEFAEECNAWCVCVCVCVCVFVRALQVRAEWVGGGRTGVFYMKVGKALAYLNSKYSTPLNSPLSINLPPTSVYSRQIPPAQLNPFQHQYAPMSMSLNTQPAVPPEEPQKPFTVRTANQKRAVVLTINFAVT